MKRSENKQIMIQSWIFFQKGVHLKGEMIVIQTNLKKKIKENIHDLRINAWLRWSKCLIFWWVMSKEIPDYVETCTTCNSYSRKKKPSIIIEISRSKVPWTKLW